MDELKGTLMEVGVVSFGRLWRDAESQGLRAGEGLGQRARHFSEGLSDGRTAILPTSENLTTAVASATALETYSLVSWGERLRFTGEGVGAACLLVAS